MNEGRYDEWKTRTPQDREVIIGCCEQCGGEIYLGDAIYRMGNGDKVHGESDYDCFQEYAEAELQAELVEGLEGIL